MPKKDNWTPEMYLKLACLYPVYTKPEIKAMTGWSIKEMTYRTGKMGIIKGNKKARELEPVGPIADEDQFIRDHFDTHSNKEIARLMGTYIQYVRDKCYKLGLYRMKLSYWTDEQVTYLQENYRQIGDVELAKMFQEKWPKDKPWHLKHIEKKRVYLALKRTREEVRAITDRNVELGAFNYGNFQPRWIDRGITKEGDVRFGRIKNCLPVPYIKINGHFILWSRYTWEQHHGPVPEGMRVVFKNSPDEWINGVEALECINMLQFADKMRTKQMANPSDRYMTYLLTTHQPEIRQAVLQQPDLLELKRQEFFLKRELKRQTTSVPETPPPAAPL